MTSIGRDGEAVDASDAGAKPRLFLRAGALVATARNLLPRHPASELIDVTPWATASGPVVLACVRHAAYYELAGPATAMGVRWCVRRFVEMGADQVVVDGALDRVAALAGGDDAVIVAAGAAAARTMEEAIDDVRALTLRLGVPRYDPAQAFIRIDGALTAADAARLVRQREQRQVVVRDPTQIALTGKALLGVSARLRLRCERPLRVIAATVASIAREHYFEPHSFAQAVAAATGLPTFDVYAAAMVNAA
jgi:hypothetical protein